MAQRNAVIYGAEPGIRFACLLDGQGGCKELTEGRAWTWHPGQGALWIHLERDEPESRRWLTQSSGLDPMIVEALLAEESRPRAEIQGEALMLVLRAVNRATTEHEPEDLVALHLWADKDRVISVRNKGQVLSAMRDLREALAGGHGPPSSGALFAQIVERTARELEPLVEGIEDGIEALDKDLGAAPHEDARKALGVIRRHSIKLRRWITPERDAIHRLRDQEIGWLGPRERARLREVTERLSRYIDCLDTARDRATILHDDLATLAAEEIGRNSHRLTAVAAILLPPILVAVLFGPTLGGAWGDGHPWAYRVGLAVEILMVPLTWWLLRRIGWR